MVRDGLWTYFLLLRMRINRDQLIVNPDLPRLYEHAVGPTKIDSILGGCIMHYE
jgi:hypothetical protein